MRFILGSGSPRRKMILENILGTVDIIMPNIDEESIAGESPQSYVFRILEEKMDCIREAAGSLSDVLVITSDTIVTIDGKILGKPSSRDDAVRMLGMLSGREHSVLTGLAMLFVESGSVSMYTAIEDTKVKFRSLEDSDIDRYLSMIRYSDKAGSYAIQENGDIVVESISGSLTNVIGFPLRLFFAMLDRSGNTRKVLGI